MQPGKMEEALIARGATVSFQVHDDTSVLVTSLLYWDTFVSEAQVTPVLQFEQHFFSPFHSLQAAHPLVIAVSSMWVLQSMAQGELLPKEIFRVPQIRSSISSDSFYGKSPSK
jgi:hypothetical protein